MLSADWSDGVRWGPIGSQWGPIGSPWGPMGSGWVISHTVQSCAVVLAAVNENGANLSSRYSASW